MSTPYAKLPAWADYGLIPLINLLLAFIVSGLVIWLIGESPIDALNSLVQGSLGSGEAISYTLFYATSFIFTGLSVAVAIHADAKDKIEKYDIRPTNPRLKTANFSGGNQQKIVLAREMEKDPGVLIVGQPTRGVDVGAIEFIHRRLIAMRDRGKAVLLISVELDEIRSLSDRILVMFAGRIVGERGPDASEGELGLLMAGVEQREAAE